MSEFIRLKPDEYRRHHISNPANFEGEATWYVHSASYNSYVRWFALAFLRPVENPEVLTFRLCSYDEDYFDYDAFWVFYESFPGKSSLEYQPLKEIVDLFKQQAEALTARPEPRASMFERIPEAEWPKFHLRQLDPNEKIIFYRQTYDPLDLDDNSDFITIITMSNSEDISSRDPLSIFLTIHRFSKDELSDPNFDPENSWLGHINLDRQGVFEFIQLLEEGWSILTSS